MQAKGRVLHACLHDVRLTFDDEKVHGLTPETFGNLYIGQQLTVFGRYSGRGPATLTLTAKISGQPRTWQCAVTLPERDTVNPLQPVLPILSVTQLLIPNSSLLLPPCPFLTPDRQLIHLRRPLRAAPRVCYGASHAHLMAKIR